MSETSQPAELTNSIIIDAMLLKNFDGSVEFPIESSVSNFRFRESIMENCIYGSFVMVDAIGLIESFPMIGEELLELKFRTDEQSKEFVKIFRVYKMTDLVKSPEMNMCSYTLHFVSPEFIESEKNKVYRSYKDKTVNSIIKDLFGYFGSSKKIEVDPTVNRQSIVFGDKTPLQAINQMALYSASPEYSGSMFMFYEDRDGFKFKTVESLYAQEPVAEYEPKHNVSGDPFKLPKFNVIRYQFMKNYDVLEAVSKGSYSSAAVGLDIVAQDFVVRNFDYTDQFKSLVHVDQAGLPVQSRLFGDSASPQRKLVLSTSLREKLSYFKSNNPEDVGFSKSAENTVLYRLNQLNLMNYIELKVVIAGNTDLKAGDIIDVTIPPYYFEDETKKSVTDIYHSGNYIIHTIDHIIDRGQYLMTLSLGRDVLGKLPVKDKF